MPLGIEEQSTSTKIIEIKNGMFSLPKRAVVEFEERSVELPVDIVMPVGNDKPILEVFNQ